MPLRWLYFTVLAPLVLLAALAAWGTRVQLDAAWSDARMRAELAAPSLARSLAKDLQAAARTVSEYPDPPIPGTPSPADAILDGTDLHALATLRDDPKAGISPAGLPRQALAAMRIRHLAPSHQSPAQLIEVLTRSAPSILTTHVLDSMSESPGVKEWWNDEAIRRQARNLEPGETRWLESGAFIRRTDSGLLHLPRSKIDAALAALDSSSGFKPMILPPDIPPPEDLVGSARLPWFEDSTRFGLRAAAEFLEAPVRRQQRWTLALLTIAVLTAGGSLLAIHRSVTRERRLVEMKTQFVSSVSHELRAPLGSIRLMAEALQEKNVANPATFHTLIAREGGRLSHLIENVLDFARIEDGRKQYHFEETDVTALVGATLDLMHPLAEDRKIHLEANLEEINATIDPNAIQQALVNLLDNALKFSPENSVVGIRLWPGDSSHESSSHDCFHLSISDQGAGILSKDHEAVFERFHRLGNELRRETQGTGIGLSIVRHIAEAHQGMVIIGDTSPQGSVFTLTLPLDQ